MGIRLITDERLEELEREAETNRIACANMSKAHERLLVSYRELRDTKDEEIERLHAVIEVLKKEIRNQNQTEKMLRQAVAYYEALRGAEVQK